MEESSKKRNINSYYGHKIGFWQSLSLILNAGLMVYAHIGLSGVIFTNQDPSATSSNNDNNNVPIVNGTQVCTENDIQIWTEAGGEPKRPIYSTFCSREYTNEMGTFCLSNPTCIATCFQTQYGYTPDCSACLGAIPLCAVGEGCSLVCAADGLGQECRDCMINCVTEMFVCSGLPEDVTTTTTNETTTGVRRQLNSTTTTSDDNVCNEWDLENVPLWYRVYDLTFVGSVNDAWNGDAQLLAVIVVFFSGFWPYAKNVILLIVWYLPMSIEWQTWTILWLSRLSKYTLVDVFAVVVVLVGVQLQLNVGGTEAIIRAEPRFGILAFFVATLWEFIQIEIIKAMHEDKVLKVHGTTTTPNKETAENEETADQEATTTTTTTDSSSAPRLYFDQQLAIPAGLWVLSVGLFVAGAMMEIVQFTSKDLTAEKGCVLSYNLVTLANALVNELGLIDNSVAWQTWVLYIVYVLLNLAFPILVHLMQFWSLLNWKSYHGIDNDDDSSSRNDLLGKLQKVSLWTSAIWCFACIEVLLIGVFAVEYKFAELISKLAGESNAVFLDISSGLGAGFYILIAYSVIAGFLQFTLRVIHPMPTSGSAEQEDKQDTHDWPQPESVYGSRIVRTYYYQEVKAEGPGLGKGARKINQAKLDVVQRHLDKFIDLNREFVSVEWVGKKFNRTPGVPHNVAVAIHSEQEVPAAEQINIERSFLGLRKYLMEDCAEQPVEGFVFAGEDGTYWKVTTKGYAERGETHPFHRNESRDKAKPPKFLK